MSESSLSSIVVTSGTVIDTENLASMQRKPRAKLSSVTSDVIITINFFGYVWIDGVAFIDCFNKETATHLMRHLIRVETRTAFSGSFVDQTESEQLVIDPYQDYRESLSPDQVFDHHFLFPQTVKCEAMKLTFRNVNEVGCIMPFRVIQSEELADRGWSFQPVDVSVVQESSGGQIYAEDGRVKRRLQIEHSSLSHAVMYGDPEKESLIDLPTPTLFGNASGSGNSFNFDKTVSSNGELNFAGLEDEQNYLLDVELRFSDYTSSINPIPQVSFISGVSNIGSVCQGRRVYHVKTNSTSLILSVNNFYATCDVIIHGVYKTSKERTFPFVTPRVIYPDYHRSVNDMIMTNGRSFPIYALLRPYDSYWWRHASFFGYIESFQNYRDNRGVATGGGFTLLETN